MELDFEEISNKLIFDLHKFVSEHPATRYGKTGDELEKITSEQDVVMDDAIAAEKKRIENLQKKIDGVKISKHLRVGTTVATKEMKDDLDFSIGKIILLDMDTGKANMQWYKLADNQDPNADDIYFNLTNDSQRIDVHKIYLGVDISIQFSDEKQLYGVSNFQQLVQKIKKYERN